MRSHRLYRCVFAVVLTAIGMPAMADSFLVTDTFAFRSVRSPNTVDFGEGDLFVIGTNVNPPTGVSVTGENQRSDTFATVTASLPFSGGGAFPTEFSRIFANSYSALKSVGITDPWKLTYTDGVNTVTWFTPDRSNVGALPFVTDVAQVGTGLNPTFNWSVPSSSANRIAISLLDDATNVRIFDNSGLNLPASTNSFTVPDTVHLTPNHPYVLRVKLEQVGLAGVITRTEKFFNFTPLPAGGADTVFIPNVGIDTNLSDNRGAPYLFDVGVSANTPVPLDPTVAVGYDFEVGDPAHDPLFTSVKVRVDIGDGLYDLYGWDGTDFDFLKQIATDELFTFAGGLSKFRLLGIEPSAMIDPNDVTAFVTDVTFDRDGRFTGSMTPLTTDVPEPGSLLLLASGVAGLAALRRRKRGEMLRCATGRAARAR